MNRAQTTALVIVLAAAVVGAFRAVQRTAVPGADEPARRQAQSEIIKPVASNGSIRDHADRESARLHEANSCISPDDLASDPALAAEFARFDALVTSGPTIESYRGLSATALAGLASQGDSAAMAVLGAISVMWAMNRPEDEAVNYLRLEGPDVQSFGFDRPLGPETTKHLETGRDWFYRAALHGRLLALQKVGEITSVTGGSPPGLGWIQQDEYDSLESFERLALDPADVYGALAFEIAPQLRTGPLGVMISDLAPGGERQQPVLQELASKYARDRAAADLPPIDIPASTALSAKEIEAVLYCSPYSHASTE